jgi:hexosaminidase
MNLTEHHLFAAALASIFLFSPAPGISSPPVTDLRLIPMPQNISPTHGALAIEKDFRVSLSGYVDPTLTRSVGRFLQAIQKKTGLSIPLSPIANRRKAKLQIQCKRPGERIQTISADESYALEIHVEGAHLVANTPIGIFRGLETFLQLVNSERNAFQVPCLSIQDKPRFCWRGLLIDVSRHWEPVDVIRRNLEAMAAVKMNVFHWHLSDDQGFRVESKIFPRLYQIASDGKYYTQKEIREVIAYARDRGIRVVPEFDMPGHTTAWLVAYPELASAPGPYSIERSWGVFDPCMDPTRERVYSFLNSFIGEMAALFPDEYFHIGGDEVNGKQWNASSQIREFKSQKGIKDNHDLQAYFNQQLITILAKHGKKMIGWDEILHPELPKGIMVQSWRGQASLSDGARKGYTGILSYGYYLDHMKPASFHYAMDPLGKEAETLSEQEKARILGGEACMWAEFVNPDNIDSRIWPRTAAIAERLWSPAETNDVRDMYRRLDYLDGELESLGLMHHQNYGLALKRISGNQGTAALESFANLVSPGGLGVRQRARKYSSAIPLDRLVDALMPESDPARKLNFMIDDAIANQFASEEYWDQIRKSLASWCEDGLKLQTLLEQSSGLSELKPVSELVLEVSKRGLQALDFIISRQAPPESWKNETASILERAEKPQGEMLISISSSIRELVAAASKMNAQKPSGP